MFWVVFFVHVLVLSFVCSSGFGSLRWVCVLGRVA